MGQGRSRQYPTAEEYTEADIQQLLKIDYKGNVKLDLENRHLKSIPLPVFQVSKLQSLNLLANQITAVPPEIAKLRYLQWLAVTRNCLCELPPEIGQLERLEILWAYGNSIQDLPATFCRLQKLYKLALHYNKLSCFPSVLLELKQLRWLNLAGNAIQVLPDALGELSNLTNLYLQDNDLVVLPNAICQLTKLVTLNVRTNKLVRLPRDFHLLVNLQPYQRGEGLDLKRNPLQLPPIEVATGDPELVRAYMRELKQSEVVHTRRLQLVVLGETGAGKTSLVRALLEGQSRLTTEKTIVLEHSLWKPHSLLEFQVVDLGGDEIYAGLHSLFMTRRAIYLVVFDVKHRYPSMNFQQYLGSWLDDLRSSVPGAVTILVGTHSDLCKDDEIDGKRELISKQIQDMFCLEEADIQSAIKSIERVLVDPYEMLDGNPLCGLPEQVLLKRKEKLIMNLKSPLRLGATLHIVSSNEGLRGIHCLISDIVQAALDIHAFPEIHIPKPWFEIQETILASSGSEPFLSMDYVKTIMREKAEVEEKTVETALSYLHAVGEIRWYSVEPSLRSIIFHRPGRLVEILQTVFRHDMDDYLEDVCPKFTNMSYEDFCSDKHRLLNCGIMSEHLMKCLWNHVTTDKHTIKQLAMVLVHLGLCGLLTNEEGGGEKGAFALQFPHYNCSASNKETAEKKWPQKCPQGLTELAMYVEYPRQFPAGLVEKTVTWMSGPSHHHVCWKTGMVCELGSTCVRTQFHFQHNAAVTCFHFRSPDVKGTWDTLMWLYNSLPVLHQRWPGLHYKVWVPCAECLRTDAEEPYLFPQEVLLQPCPRDTTHIACGSTDAQHFVPAALLYPPGELFAVDIEKAQHQLGGDSST